MAESVTMLQKRGTAGRLYDSVMEDGMDAGEAVAAFKELFEGIYKPPEGRRKPHAGSPEEELNVLLAATAGRGESPSRLFVSLF